MVHLVFLAQPSLKTPTSCFFLNPFEEAGKKNSGGVTPVENVYVLRRGSREKIEGGIYMQAYTVKLAQYN